MSHESQKRLRPERYEGVTMKNYFDLTGKYALVVGASSGLGAQFARALAEQGAEVAVAARRRERLEALCEEIRGNGGKAIAVSVDVSDEASVIQCVSEVKKAFGRIDILVNNAGMQTAANILEFPTADWDRTFNINLRGQFLMSREVGKIMKENHYGKIINTASIAGYGGGFNLIAYHASKGGVVNFTRALAADMAPYGVTVNAIGPGVFDSELTHDILESDMVKATLQAAPLKRHGNEGELNGALLYFASDASSYCTGQILYVDGGLTSQI